MIATPSLPIEESTSIEAPLPPAPYPEALADDVAPVAVYVSQYDVLEAFNAPLLPPLTLPPPLPLPPLTEHVILVELVSASCTSGTIASNSICSVCSTICSKSCASNCQCCVSSVCTTPRTTGTDYNYITVCSGRRY